MSSKQSSPTSASDFSGAGFSAGTRSPGAPGAKGEKSTPLAKGVRGGGDGGASGGRSGGRGNSSGRGSGAASDGPGVHEGCGGGRVSFRNPVAGSTIFGGGLSLEPNANTGSHLRAAAAGTGAAQVASKARGSIPSPSKSKDPDSIKQDKLNCIDKPGLKNHTTPFLDKLEKTMARKKDEDFVTWYGNDGNPTDEKTFGKLWEEAGAVANHLRHEKNISKGDRVVLCFNFGLDFISTFLGCLRAGIVAVPVYPPNPTALTESLTKMNQVIDNCDATLILTDSSIMKLRSFHTSKLNVIGSTSKYLWPGNDRFYFDTTAVIKSHKTKQTNTPFMDENSTADDIAFLQYTSGSTGNPKGVMITFGALAANVELIHDGFRQCYENDGGLPDPVVGFSWLPQHHDLGLIYATLAPLSAGWRMHMMSPLSFLSNPLLWVELMSRHKVSWGVAPDFAYNLVVKKFKERQAKLQRDPTPTLDLSCLRYLKCGAEPIRVGTKENFGTTFKKYKLRDDWFFSGYGLAENVVGVSWIHSHTTSSSGGDSPSFVAVGSRSTFHQSLTVKIVDPATLKELPDGETGEVLIAGPSVAKGYFRQEELSAGVFGVELNSDGADDTKFLRTGDLAFFENDNLFLCGRIKDLIIVRGVNYYPQDIELVVQTASKGVRPGCVAAFSEDESKKDGNVEIVFELRGSFHEQASEITRSIHMSVSKKTGLVPTRIVAIKERSIPKTTSGKIQRRRTRSALRDGELDVVFDSAKGKAEVPQRTTLAALKASLNPFAPCLPEDGTALQAKTVQANGVSPDAAQLISSLGRKSELPNDFDSDVLVVGAGIVGICFARDMASLGHKVTIVEKANQVGGTWARNSYPGLRLHQPGCSYRCLSLAPNWTKVHESNEFYRPTRDEVFAYCKEMVQHDKITVLLETECDYEARVALSDNSVAVDVGRKKHKTRYVFASTGCYVAGAGQPVIPVSLDSTPGLRVYHSSQINGKAYEQLKECKGRKIVVGSGKAAIDVLQAFDHNDLVLWAHRGHTLFVDRKVVNSMFLDDQLETVAKMMNAILMSLDTAAMSGTLKRMMHLVSSLQTPNGALKRMVHMVSSSREDVLGETLDPILISCKGPMSSRAWKFGGGVCDKHELSYADKFKQFPLGRLDKISDQCIRLKSNVEGVPDVDLTSDDFIILATGQRNDDRKDFNLTSNFAESAPYTLNSGCLNAIIPLLVASDALAGKDISPMAQRTIQELQSQLHDFNSASTDPREYEYTYFFALNSLVHLLLPGLKSEIAYMSQWQNDWYGKDMSVNEVFDYMCRSTRTPMKVGPSTAANAASALELLSTIRGETIHPSDAFGSIGFTSIELYEFRSQLCNLLGVSAESIPLNPIIFANEDETAASVLETLLSNVDSASKEPKQLETEGITCTLPYSDWLVQPGGLRGTPEQDVSFLFCFMGFGGNSAHTFQDFYHQLPNSVVPFIVRFPWEVNAMQSVSDVSGYVDRIAKEIARFVTEAEFSILGHSAGGLLAYLVGQRLLEKDLDLSPLVHIIASSQPPQSATPFKSMPLAVKFQKNSLVRKQLEELSADAQRTTPFWKEVLHQARMASSQGVPIFSPLVVVGGKDDDIISQTLLEDWSSMTKRGTKTVILPGHHFIPVARYGVFGSESFEAFWAQVGHEIQVNRESAKKQGMFCFGPIRSALTHVSGPEKLLFRMEMKCSATYNGIIPLEGIVKQVEQIIQNDPRLFRFQCALDISKGRWEHIPGWTARSYIVMANDAMLNRNQRWKAWKIDVEHNKIEGSTRLNYTFNHAMGDAFSANVLLKKLHGCDVQKPEFRSNNAFFQKLLANQLETGLRRMAMNFPYSDSKQELVVGSKVRPIQLANLSVTEVKAFGKKYGATVNDVLLMIVSETKRRFGEPHQWLQFTMSGKTNNNWDDLRNCARIVPCFVGNGDLKTIQKYTHKLKLQQYLKFNEETASSEQRVYRVGDGKIIGLTNLVFSLGASELLGHLQTEGDFYVNIAGMVCAGSLGDTLRCRLTVHETDLEEMQRFASLWASVSTSILRES